MGDRAQEKWAAFRRRLPRGADLSGVDERFLPYFRTMQRIRVRLPGGKVASGTVTAQRSSAPRLLLQRRLNSARNPEVLHAGVELLAELRGENYVDIGD